MALCINYRRVIILCTLLFFAYPVTGWSYSIHLNFVSAFEDSFTTGGPWDSLDEEDVKDAVVDFVTDLYDPFGISVSTTSGDVEVRVGVYADGYFGLAEEIGGYLGNGNDRLARVDTDLIAGNPAVRGTNATLSRVSNLLGVICAHEAGHVFNLHHAYAYEAFDPLISGTLDGDYYPRVPNHTMPIAAKADSANANYHVMGTPEYGHVTVDEMTAGGQTFTPMSTNMLEFVVGGGDDVTINTTWALKNREFDQQQDITVASGKLLIIAGGGYTHDLNGYGITGAIEKHGTVTPDGISIQNSGLKGLYSDIQGAIDAWSSGDEVALVPGTYNENIDMASGVHLTKNGAGTVTIDGTVDFNSVSGGTVDSIRFDGLVTLYAAGGVTFNGCEFWSGSTYGVSVTNGTPNFFNGCDFWASTDGIKLNNSDPFIDACHIHGNSQYGITATNGSEPDVVGANHLYENWDEEIIADSDCDDIYATDNYWGSLPPDVYHDGSPTYQIYVDTAYVHTKPVLASLQEVSDITRLRKTGRQLLREGQAADALQPLKQLVETYPYDKSAQLALGHLIAAYQQLGEAQQALVYLESLANRTPNAELVGLARFHIIPVLVALDGCWHA